MTNQIQIYRTPEQDIQVDVRFEEDTVWLTQVQILELFDSSKANISEHITHIFGSGELDAASTVRKFRTVRTEGNRQVEREIDFYNLDVIISIGYRVKSLRGTQFRMWATEKENTFLQHKVAPS